MYGKVLVTGMMVTALALGGCYKSGYTSGMSGGGGVHKQKVTHYLWGAAGGGKVDLEKMCPAGVASIHEEKTFVDQLLSTVTGFLYTPKSVVVECAGDGASASAD